MDAYASELANAQPQHRASTRQAAHGVDARKAQAATIRARTGAIRSAADILVGGPPVPPSPAVQATISNQFITAVRIEQQELQLRTAMAAAHALPEKAKCTPRLRGVAQQVARSKAAAGPGPSGWRNSHIACAYAYPGGPHAL